MYRYRTYIEHEFDTVEPTGFPVADMAYRVLCTCFNPDGEHEGGGVFYGSTPRRAIIEWSEHLPNVSSDEWPNHAFPPEPDN